MSLLSDTTIRQLKSVHYMVYTACAQSCALHSTYWCHPKRYPHRTLQARRGEDFSTTGLIHKELVSTLQSGTKLRLLQLD